MGDTKSHYNMQLPACTSHATILYTCHQKNSATQKESTDMNETWWVVLALWDTQMIFVMSVYTCLMPIFKLLRNCLRHQAIYSYPFHVKTFSGNKPFHCVIPLNNSANKSDLWIHLERSTSLQNTLIIKSTTAVGNILATIYAWGLTLHISPSHLVSNQVLWLMSGSRPFQSWVWV